MAFKQPRNWKQLERHPLSAEYEDLVGERWDALVKDIEENGFDKRKPIYLLEGRIGEGWQRQRACLACDVRPVYAPFPKGVDPEAFIARENDQRRHESKDAAERRIEARRKRVAEAREEGKSFAAIAEDEGISKTQAKRDAKSLENDVPAGPHGPPDHGKHQAQEATTPEKVTGLDGKTYPKAAKKPAKLLCDACKHRVVLGRPLIKDCENCAKRNAEAGALANKILSVPPAPPPANDESVEEEREDGEIIDDNEDTVPGKLRHIFAQAPLFRSAADQCAKTAKTLEKLQKTKAYTLADPNADRRVYSTYFRTAEKKLRDITPSKLCCEEKKCSKCGGKGYLTKGEAK
jgi:hypothetical protein